MPAIFRISCSECDADKPDSPSFAGYAGMVRRRSWASGGRLESEGYWAYLKEDNSLLPLPHPLEDAVLAGEGVKWGAAERAGRLVSISNLICPDCGELNQDAKMASAPFGCIAGIVLGCLALAANTWLLKLPKIVEFGMFWGCLCLPFIAISRLMGLRYARNWKPFAFTRCRQCGSRRSLSLQKATKFALPCPRCKQHTLYVVRAGIS